MKQRSLKYSMFNWLVTLGASALLLAGCNSSSDSVTSSVGGDTISGTVAVGLALSGGDVYAVGAAGNTTNTTIGLDGSYSLDVGDLTEPFMIYAEGTIMGETRKLYSSGVTGIINITPITDFIVRKAAQALPEDIWDNWENEQIDEIDLDAAEAQVREQLQPVLNAAGVADVDLISTEFIANHSGIDAVLDLVDIEIDESNVATVVNTLTDSTFIDDLEDTADDQEAILPPEDETDTEDALTDRTSYQACFDQLRTMYASSRPSAPALEEWFTECVTEDFLDNGRDMETEFNDWAVEGYGPPVGLSMDTMVKAEMDPVPEGYTAGYWVTVYYSAPGEETGQFDSGFVYDGSRWYWYGNQKWLDAMDEEGFSQVLFDGRTGEFSTGFDLYIDDESLYAYDLGVRSLIISGPGLPEGGLVMQHMYGEVNAAPEFRIYDQSTGETSWNWYFLDDETISTIPEDAEYTLGLYTQEAASVSLENTAIETYEFVNRTPPVANTDLNASFFPTNIAATLGDDDTLTVTWDNPTGGGSIEWVSFGWWDGESDHRQETEILGQAQESAGLDLSGMIPANGVEGGWFHIGGYENGVEFAVEGSFSIGIDGTVSINPVRE